MKIFKASETHYDKNYPQNTSLNKIPTNKFKGRDVYFGSFKSGVSGFVDAIEKKGFFTEFLVLDSFSMIIPRISIGLNRDREKTGKINYKAGIEEAGRELLSGPSMFLIPMAILSLYKKYAPASHMESNTLNGLTSNMKQVINQTKNADLLADKNYLNTKLAGKIFDNSFGRFTLENKEALKTEFIKLLNKSTTTKPSSTLINFFKRFGKSKNHTDSFKQASNEFEKLIILINNSNKSKVPIDTQNLKIFKGSVSAEHLFEDFHNYSKDIIEKLSRKNFIKNMSVSFKNDAKNFLLETGKSRINAKFIKAATAFFAVGGFLLYLPKLYQQGNISPAMESVKRIKNESSEKGGTTNES
jgi:hypothetical protein